MGGRSAEREVSLVSGARLRRRAAPEGLRRAADRRRPRPRRSAARPRARVPMRSSTRCTAASARTAAIQGLLDLLSMPYTHSGLLASALAMDKPLAKRVFATVGLRCPEGKVVTRRQPAEERSLRRAPMWSSPPPKAPASACASCATATTCRRWAAGTGPSAPQVLVERYIPGRELTVAVMGERGAGA